MSLYYLWYAMGYDCEDEISPSEQTVRVRHEMLKQIKLSSVKLAKPAPMLVTPPTLPARPIQPKLEMPKLVREKTGYYGQK